MIVVYRCTAFPFVKLATYVELQVNAVALQSLADIDVEGPNEDNHAMLHLIYRCQSSHACINNAV